MTDTEQKALAMTAAELIEKLERADGPSRVLDAEIAKAVGLFAGTRASYELQADMITHYTASIDAALTLVPDGWAVRWLRIWPGQQSSCCLAGTHSEHGEQYHDPKDGEVFGRAITPAIALCIAALKAKEADNGKSC